MSEEIPCRWCGTRLPNRGKELLCLACGTWFPGHDQGRRAERAGDDETRGAGDPTWLSPMSHSEAVGALEEDDFPDASQLLRTPDPDAMAIGPGAPVLLGAAPLAPQGRRAEEPFVIPPTATYPSALELLEDDSSVPGGTLATPDPDASVRAGPTWHSSVPQSGSAPPEIVPDEPSASFPPMDFHPAPAPEPSRAADREPAEAEEEEFEEVHGTPWLNVLLLSYASAVTIACFWLWTHRRPAERPAEDFPNVPVDTRPDPGARAAATAKVEPAPPLSDDRLTTLGRPLRVGALELTPLEVRKGKVTLVVTKFDGHQENRDGGDNALLLRVRLRNISEDLIFAPLDEAFLRDRDRELPDSFLETADGERIYTYRLPVHSERAIVGQKFAELKPGEAMETVVVSDTDAVDRAQGPLTWRLRLRTGDQKTDVVGVRFEGDKIK